MKSPSPLAVSAATRKSSLAAAHVQRAAGSRGLAGSSRLASRSHVPRTNTAQVSLNRSILSPPTQGPPAVGSSVIPACSTVPSAPTAVSGSRAVTVTTSSNPATVVTSPSGASASTVSAASGGNDSSSSSSSTATPAVSRSPLRSAKAAPVGVTAPSSKSAALCAAVPAAGAALPATVDAPTGVTTVSASVVSLSPTKTNPQSSLPASNPSSAVFPSLLSATAETSAENAAAVVSFAAPLTFSPSAEKPCFSSLPADASSAPLPSSLAVAAASSKSAGVTGSSSAGQQQVAAATPSIPLISLPSVSATTTPLVGVAEPSAIAYQPGADEASFVDAGDLLSSPSFGSSTSISSVADRSSSAVDHLAGSARSHLSLSHDSTCSQTSQFSSDVGSMDRRLGHVPSLPHAVKEARAHSLGARHVDSLSDSPKARQEFLPHGDGFQPLLSAASISPVMHGSIDISDQQKEQEPAEDIELLKFMAKARLAASVEQWPDVISAMKKVAAVQPSLTLSQRILLTGAYSNQLNELRLSRKQLHTRVGALKFIQQPQPQEETGDQNIFSSSAEKNEAMRQVLEADGKVREASRPAAVVKREQEEQEGPPLGESISLSFSLQGMPDADEENKAGAERFREKRMKATALLGESFLGELTLTQYAPFFEYMTVHYRQRVAESMIVVLNDMETFVVSVLLPAAESPEFRDLKKHSECLDAQRKQTNDQLRLSLERKSKMAYETAIRHAEEAMPTKVSSLRLVLLQEMDEGRGVENAIDYLGNEFQQTVRQMYEVRLSRRVSVGCRDSLGKK